MPRHRKSTLDEKQQNRAFNKVSNFCTGFDDYGDSVSLSFNGEGTKQTIPGGIISIFIWVVLLLYGVLQIKSMLNKEDWELTSQTAL